MGAGGRGVSRSGRQGRQGDGRIRSGRGRESFITRTDSFTFHHNDRHSEAFHSPPALPPPLSLLPTWSLARLHPRLIVPLVSPFHMPANFLNSHYQMENDAPTPSSAYRPLILGKRERFSGTCSDRGRPTHCTRSVSTKESAGSKSWFLSLYF